MKKFLAFVMMISSFSVFAECYPFYNGAGPDRLGGVRLEAQAGKMCYSKTARSEKLTFSDSEGTLAIVEVVSSRERRPNGNVTFSLSYGNAGGRNVDFSGSTVVVTSETHQSPTGVVRKILVDNQEFYSTQR